MQRYAYDSFGNMRHHGDDIRQPYVYTGREWDEEIGLYYYRARYYDARAGRFIKKDPIGFAGGDVNLYVYVGNNPINAYDPSGLGTFECPNGLKSCGFTPDPPVPAIVKYAIEQAGNYLIGKIIEPAKVYEDFLPKDTIKGIMDRFLPSPRNAQACE